LEVDRVSAQPSGAKKRDYFFTVLFVDPLAVPLTRGSARLGMSPDTVSWLSLLYALPIGFAFGTGERWGLFVGAALWYMSFLLDCVDGKLARATEQTSERGRLLDSFGDGARRASSVLGMVAYLYKTHDPTDAFIAAIFGVLAFYVIELSGGEMSGPGQEPRGKWARWLARYRLLPNPGMTDVSAIAFVIGPVTGFVFPAVIVALVLTCAAVLRNLVKVIRAV
jgi:phosphatidylglycerophosphate synthase